MSTVPDLDIWRAADLLIRQHGEDAEVVVATMAVRCLGRGNIDGQRVWLRIRRAVAELEAPPSGWHIKTSAQPFVDGQPPQR